MNARERQRRWRANDPERYRDLQYKWRESHYANHLFNSAKSRAKARGIPFDISLEDIVIPEFCPVLGVKLEVAHGSGRQQDCSPSLDCFDPKLGYVKGNVNVISWRANHIKNDGTLEELERLVTWMRSKEAK